MLETKINIVEVNSKERLNTFLKLPWDIYMDNPYWIPPLLFVQKQLLNKKKNPFFQNANMALWYVEYHNKPSGRIAAFINNSHNDYYNDKVGFWGYFESINNQGVASVLLEKAVQWLKQRGMNCYRGPINLSTLHETGLLIDGFKTEPSIDTMYNPEYYSILIENAGFKLKKVLLAYYLDQSVKNDPLIMPRLRKWSKLIQQNTNIVFKTITKQKFLSKIELACDLYNQFMCDNWGYFPVTIKEFKFIASSFRNLIVPEVTLFAEVKGKPVGFSLSIPDINPIIRKINGRLFPFGFFKILYNYKKVSRLRVILMGVSSPYRFKGIETVFIQKTIDDGTKIGFEGADLSWLDGDNQNLINTMLKLKAEPYKRFGIFEKHSKL